MNSQEKNIKKIILWIVILILAMLVFFLLKPVFISVIAGLILAYVFRPAYFRLFNWTKRKNISAFIISLIVILIILIPVWFVVPLMLQQVFNLFTASQSLDTNSIVRVIFPTAAEQFISKMVITLDSFIGKMTTIALEYLNGIFLDIPLISLHIAIVFFVFFYALRDFDKMTSFLSELSPFTKSNEKAIISQFESITDSVIYGQIIIGLVQGGLTGLGLLLFGVDNVLVLTVLAIFLSILPVIGPFLIWIPVSVYFFASGNISIGIGYLLYNLLIVSTVDNILRTYLVSRRTDISPAIIFVSMIGGFLIFGLVGFLLGPLIVAYFIMFLQAFRKRNLHSLIHEGE